MPDDATAQATAPCARPGLSSLDQTLPHKAHSFRDILRSSAIIGSSSAINVLIGMVRTKAMAVLLGPEGYGLMGAYGLITELTRNVAQMGLNASGVRQIASAVESGQTERVALTVAVLRRTSLICALLGATLLALFSTTVSTVTFGSDQYAHSIAILAIAVFFSVIAGGQGALLQGMRRIGDMAKLAVLGAVLGTVIGIPMVYYLGVAGLAPTLVLVAASSALTSWWYSRKVKITVPDVPFSALAQESTDLLKLGLAFMASGLLTAGAAYVVRIIVLRQVGLEAAGVYGAAWVLGGLYIGFVLQALGTDFYPRLVGVAQDNEACNRMVNEQAHVSMLLAVPGVLGTLTLASLAISLFYSARFAPGVDVLRWICIGMAMRVLTWPIGFIVVAKNRQVLFFAIDMAWTVVYVALTWWCVGAFGVIGAGIAFFASYVFHALLVYPIVRRLSGFRWTPLNLKTASYCCAVVGAVFIGFRVLSPVAALAFGILATIASSYVSIRILVHLVAPERLPRPIAFLLQIGTLRK